MAGKVQALEDALRLVPDGARLGVGGILLQRKPVAFLAALARAGRRDLRFHSFLASLDAELLAAHGVLAEAHTGYVGFEHLGFAPAYTQAVADGRVASLEYSEFHFVAGLRAALAGLPFMPTKAAAGSQVTEELGYVEIACPYSGVPVTAVPAMRLDVAVVHAAAADERGNVLGPEVRDFLFDFDANIARAADRVVVTVERVSDIAETRAARGRVLLFGYEVDAVVALPGGAAPTAVPGSYPADVGALRRYLARTAEGTPAHRAMDELVPA